MKSLKLLLASAILLLLGACSTINSGVSFENYRNMDKEARNGYMNEVNAKVTDKATYDQAQEKLLLVGLPTQFEVDGIKLTKIWDKQARRLSFYDGYVTGALGSESLLILSIMTEKGNPAPEVNINKQTGKPEYTVLAGNVSVQESVGRVVLKSAFGIATAASNGYFAAVKAAGAACKGDCGGDITLVNAGGNSSAGALSTSQSNTSVKVDLGCPSGGCATKFPAY